MKAVFLDRGSFPDRIQFNLPSELDYVEYENTKPEQVLERIQDADILITNKVVLSAEALASNPKLKYIQITATGVNNVDISYCEKHQIQVNNVAGYSINSVPEHTFSMLLALKRNLFSYTQAVKNGRWGESEHFTFFNEPIRDLAGTNLVIFGKGALGTKVATIAEAFNMKVYFAERKNVTQIREGYIAFDEALALADVISLHCPLTEDTRNMIAEAEFAQMKPSCILINMGRGGLVSESALVNAIEQKQIAAAGFDVATVEPMPKDHVLQALTQYPNFLLTPHNAWASDEAMQTLANLAMDKITSFLTQS